MINTIAAAAVAISAVVLPPAGTPPPGEVTAELVTVDGSGCHGGTVAVAVSPDDATFHVPQGFTFGIDRVDHRGFAHLERGAAGTLRGNHYFQGMPASPHVKHTWHGPMSDDWEATNTVDIGMPVVRRCGEATNLNINTESRVNAGTSDPTTSFMAMDSTDAYIASVYHFSWTRCP